MDDKEPKQVNWWHLLYTIIICMLVCSGVILCQTKAVSDTAFTNFSFAATITSIVLAVVSIVYSIISGNGVNDNLSSIRQIEKSIRDNLDAFTKIESRITDRLAQSEDELKAGVEEVKSGLGDVKNKLNEWVNTNQTARDCSAVGAEGTFDIEHNSWFGNILLYACYALFNKNKLNRELDLVEIVGDGMDPDYMAGYFAAISCACSSHFMAIVNRFAIILQNFDMGYFKGIDKFFQSQSFTERAKEKDKELINNILKKIDQAVEQL